MAVKKEKSAPEQLRELQDKAVAKDKAKKEAIDEAKEELGLTPQQRRRKGFLKQFRVGGQR